MVRVLFVTERWFPQGGGGEIDHHGIASFLAKAGLEVFVLTGESPSLRKEIPHPFKFLLRLPTNYIPDEKFHFANLLKRIFFIFKLLKKTIFIVRKYNIDLIHTSTPLLSMLLFLIRNCLKRPLIASNFSYFLNRWQKILNSYFKAKLFETIELISYKLPYSCLVSVSPKFIELVRRYGITTPIVHIPNAVDFEIFNPYIDSKNTREQYLPSDGKYLISFIGRLVPQKGIDVLVKAIPHVNSFVKNCMYLIVGEGTYREKLENIAKKLSIKNIAFTGMIQYSKIPELISASDIIILPSLGAEGSPRVLLETMACGKPVIATKIRGIKEQVIDGKTGVLVEEGNVHQLTEAVISLLRNKQNREEIGKNAYEFVKDKFAWTHVGNETLKIYRQVISSYRR